MNPSLEAERDVNSMGPIHSYAERKKRPKRAVHESDHEKEFNNEDLYHEYIMFSKKFIMKVLENISSHVENFVIENFEQIVYSYIKSKRLFRF